MQHQKEGRRPEEMTSAEFKRRVVEAAKKVTAATGYPWQLVAAQACLETGYGRHVPVDGKTGKYSYNIFGIKGAGPAGSVLCETTEYYPPARARQLAAEGKAVMTNDVRNGLVKCIVNDYFKAFHSFEEALEWYMKLVSTPRYRPVWEHAGDPVAAARAIQRCGYATDPGYADKLIAIMRQEGWLDKPAGGGQ